MSISLADDDASFLDAHALEEGLASRSAPLHEALQLLRSAELGSGYEAAWSEWPEADQEMWECTTSDGLP